MEIYVRCLSITTNHKETHKSLLDFPERLTCQIASCSLYFSKTKQVLRFQKSEVDKKQMMEGPNCTGSIVFIAEALEDWMGGGWSMNTKAAFTCQRGQYAGH